MRKIVLAAILVMGVMAINAKPLIVGHRGVPVYAPENSVTSQQLAWDLNADGAEFDVWLTADKKLMVMHDKNTSRTSGGASNLDMKKSKSSELAKVDVGVTKDPAFEGEKLPHFEDMLACHPKGKVLFIEIKDNPDSVEYVKKGIEASGRPDNEFVVISFNYDTCVEARKQLPNTEVYLLEGAQNKKTKKVEKFTSEILKKAKDGNLTGVDLDYRGVTPELIKECKDMGMKFLVWTVDDKQDVTNMVKWGAEGITTNRADYVRRYMEEALEGK